MPDPSTQRVSLFDADEDDSIEVYLHSRDSKRVVIQWYCGERHTYEHIQEIVEQLDATKDCDSWLFVSDDLDEWLYLRVVGRYLYVALNEGEAMCETEYLKDSLEGQRVPWRRLKNAIEKVLG